MASDDIERQGPGTQAKTWRSRLSKFCSSILLAPLKLVSIALSIATLISVFAVLFVVWVPLYAILYSILPRGSTSRNWSSAHGIGGIYEQSRYKETLMDRIKSRSLRLVGRATLVVLLGLLLSISVRRLKSASVLGSPLWKWSLLSVTLTAAYFPVVFIIWLILYIPLYVWKTETASYYWKGLGTSMNLVTYFGMVLVTWLVYFSTEQGLKQASTTHPQAFEYVTWTVVFLFAGSILWLFKALLLARWSAHVIYHRFAPRILLTSLKYFFIGLVAADFHEDRIIDELQVLEKYGGDDGEANRRLFKSVKKYIMSRKMGLTYLDYASSFLTSLAETVSPFQDLVDEDGTLREVRKLFESKLKAIGTTDVSSSCGLQGLINLLSTTSADPTPQEQVRDLCSALKFLTEFVSDMDNTRDKERNVQMAHVLYRIVREECSSDSFTYDELMLWMVDAHKDCINMGRTLADAKAIVSRLDRFMSSVIIVMGVLLWLLVTGVASTTVLATIAAPFLTLTFIFGDAAKTFFQGLIFCFASHPLDVGDRCILDQTELEVKSVSILTTTFIKIGSKEKRVYPNSLLATKSIVNLGWQPDVKDVVELTIDPSVNLEDLETKVIEVLTSENKTYKNEPYKLVVEEVGNKTRVKIHFTHVLTVRDLSHSQCFEKKSVQRSDFLKIIIQSINESQIDPSRSANSTTSDRGNRKQLTLRMLN